MTTSGSCAASLGRQTVVPRSTGRARVRNAPRTRHVSLRALRAAPPLVLFSVLMFQLWVRISIISAGYEIERLRADAIRNDALLRQLKLERALVTRPSRLTDEAGRRLRLEPTPPNRIRTLDLNAR